MIRRISCRFLWIFMLTMFQFVKRIQPFRFGRAPFAASHVAVHHRTKGFFFPQRRTMTIQSAVADEIIEKYKEELISLRGDPELIDRLESLTIKHPGIEVNPNLYQLFFPFKLDHFQIQGLTSLISGNNVLVMTPTGSGKTIVGELAIYFALMMRLRVIYTTPLKALSNQKFQDFRQRFGGDRVGLLTGEISINKYAPVVVMTTEVLRNMIYDTEASHRDSLNDIFMVCFDEFHYMNDPDRGTVWEECLISCPPDIRILALSATVGNIHEIKDWISNIHGTTEVIQSDYRPVPLRYLYAMRPGLFPYFRDPNAGPGSLNGITKRNGVLDGGSKINPSILRIEDDAEKSFLRSKSGGSRERGGGGRRRGRDDIQEERDGNRKELSRDSKQAIARGLIPSYNKIIEELFKINKLPAIFFIFSRDGCEEAARNAGNAIRSRLLTKDEKSYIENAIQNFLELNPLIPVNQESINLLKKGISVHHAGLITVWKGLIEELFIANKIKVLFATETLAAGVNMPARTTVITSVTKKIGKTTSTLRTSQLLQMAGRAGRRGKDVEGTVVLMRNRFDSPDEPHRILVSPIDGIKSQFKASYAFVIKLLSTKTIEDCRQLIERGFGTYLAQKYARKRKNRNKAILKDGDSSVKLFPILSKYPITEMKAYMKLLNRIKKEKNSLDYLISKNIDTDQELIDIFTEYMAVGSILQLKSGDIGYFLGDMMIDGNTITFYSADARLLNQEKEEREISPLRQESGVREKNFFQSFFSSSSSTQTANAPSSYSSQILASEEDLVSELIPNDDIDANDKSFGKKKRKGNKQVFSRTPAYGMLTQSGDFLCFRKEDIRHLIALDNPLQSSPPMDEVEFFSSFVNLIMHIQGWEKVAYHQHPSLAKSHFYKARYSLEDLQKANADLFNAVHFIRSQPPIQPPEDLIAMQQRQNHEIVKQEKILLQLQEDYQTHVMTQNNDTQAIFEFFDHLSTIRDNKESKNFIDTQIRLLNTTRLQMEEAERSAASSGGSAETSEAWLMFLEVIKVLKEFEAIELLPPAPPTPTSEDSEDGTILPLKVTKRLTYKATEFGEMVGSFTTENDLWVSLVIRHPAVERLTVHEFAGLMAAIMSDSGKASTAFYQYETSDNVQDVITELLPLYQRLYDLQQDSDLEFPILLASEICGIVEQWAKGMTWLELCTATSLEQGDLYRILKRTVEILRSIPQAYQVSVEIVEKAKEALYLVNRFPLVESIEDLETGGAPSSFSAAIGANNTISVTELQGVESSEELSHAELEEEELEELDREFIDEEEDYRFEEGDDDAVFEGRMEGIDDRRIEDVIPFSSSSQRRKGKESRSGRGIRTSVEQIDFNFSDEELHDDYDDEEEEREIDNKDEEGERFIGKQQVGVRRTREDIEDLLEDIEKDLSKDREEEESSLKEQVDEDQPKKSRRKTPERKESGRGRKRKEN